MKDALNTLNRVLKELDLAETESIRIICDIISRSAKKYKAKELSELAEIVSLWNKEPLSEILEKLKELQSEV